MDMHALVSQAEAKIWNDLGEYKKVNSCIAQLPIEGKAACRGGRKLYEDVLEVTLGGMLLLFSLLAGKQPGNIGWHSHILVA